MCDTPIQRVLRDGDFKMTLATDIVPGDVVGLQRGPAACDMVILRGSNLILDESGLTGEATPVAKTAIDHTVSDIMYNSKDHASNTIFAGTHIEQAGGSDLAIVVATGSFTAKGGLLTEIFAFEGHKPLFEEDLRIVVMILMAETIFLWTPMLRWSEFNVVQFFSGKSEFVLDLLTFVVQQNSPHSAAR
jgi:magnesium-transporting ATPase (P-type)